MNIYSASFNFPSGFIWGVFPGEDSFLPGGNYPFLFQLKENHIKSVLIKINWADYEPLKNNYDENRIDSLRTLLSRIRNQNIEPVLLFSIGEVPQWQNLENRSRNNIFIEDRYKFVSHVINALISYSEHYCFECSASSMTSNRALQAEIDLHKEIHSLIHSLSDSALAGTVIPGSAFKPGRKSLFSFLSPFQLSHMTEFTTDFFAASANPETVNGIQKVFGKERRPLLMITDNLKLIPSNDRLDHLSDRLYEFWHLYQQGWPVLGFFSEIDINTETPEKELYINSCINNSFEISTGNPHLSYKWIHLLKD